MVGRDTHVSVPFACPTELHDILHQLSEVVKDVPEICLTRIFEESEAECATSRDSLQQQHTERMEALMKEHVRVTLMRAMLVVQLASSTLSSLRHSGFSYVPAEACPGAPQQGERVGCTGPPREGETQAGLAAPLSTRSSREGGPQPPQPTLGLATPAAIVHVTCKALCVASVDGGRMGAGFPTSHSSHWPLLPPLFLNASQEVEELHAKRFAEKVLQSVLELVGALDEVTLHTDIIPPCE